MDFSAFDDFHFLPHHCIFKNLVSESKSLEKMTGDFCNTRKKKSIGGGVKSLALKQDELGRLQDKLSYSLSGMSEPEGRGARG